MCDCLSLVAMAVVVFILYAALFFGIRDLFLFAKRLWRRLT